MKMCYNESIGRMIFTSKKNHFNYSIIKTVGRFQNLQAMKIVLNELHSHVTR